MLRFLAIACAAAALAVGVWWWSAAVEPDPVPAAREAAPAAAALELPPPASTPALVEREQELRHAEGEEALAGAVAGSPSPQFRIHGSIVVIDEAGLEHPAASGSIAFYAEGPQGLQRVDASVLAGGFTAAVAERCTAIRVLALELDGRSAIPEIRDAIPLDASSAVRVRATFATDLVVRVRDAVSGVDLTGVTLLRVSDWRRADRDHPGEIQPGEVVAEHAVSPVRVRNAATDFEALAVWTCFGRADGYCWNKVRIEPTGPATHQMFLHRGGGLDLAIEGDERAPATWLRCRTGDAGGEPALELPLGSERALAIEGLAPGTWQLAAEIGDWWDEPIVVGAASVDVPAGGRAAATLRVGAPPRAARVPFAGTLLLAPEFGLERFSLRLELLDPAEREADQNRWLQSSALTSDPARPGRFGFDFGTIPAGFYEVGVSELGYSISFRLGPAGDTSYVLEIPPPAICAVRVVEAATGSRAEVDSVLWTCRRPEGVSGGSLENSAWNEATGTFEFLAPQGDVLVHIWADTYQFFNEHFRLGPGRNEIEVRLERSCGLVIVLRDGAHKVAWPSDGNATLAEIGGDGTSSSWGERDGSLRVGVTKPGRYRVTIPSIEGYEPVSPVEIEIAAGQFAECAVPLVPRR